MGGKEDFNQFQNKQVKGQGHRDRIKVNELPFDILSMILRKIMTNCIVVSSVKREDAYWSKGHQGTGQVHKVL